MAVTSRNGIKANWVGDNGWLLRGGKLVFDPENDGDDDSHANTDKDHDFWTVGGRPLKKIPSRPSAAEIAAAKSGDSGDDSDGGDDSNQTPAQKREVAFRKMASTRRR
jgi:hypothetical protein